MKISIIGTGYVGLVTGVCLSDRGHSVVCVDVDPAKVDMINSGRAPIHERGLPELLTKHIGKGLKATTRLAEAVIDSDITFIAVGTPAVDGHIDLKFVEQAAIEVGQALRDKNSYHVVVVKSTVIPGSTDGPIKLCLERGAGKKAGVGFGLGMNPEFLTEGRAVDDFMFPDRIVIGGIDDRSQKVLQKVYESFENAPRVFTNCRTAEMIKYASNAVLATMISFSNEFARLCSAIGDVDVAEVMRGVHQSVRFTTRLPDGSTIKAPITAFLEAGCGFGGSCLPKDVTALVAQGADHGLGMPMMRSVLEINRNQPAEMIRLIRRHYPDLSGVKVTVLGLAFKPDTDDLRESPSFPVVELLRGAGASVTAFDPVAKPIGHAALAGVKLTDTLRDALASAEVVVLVTRWAEFDATADVLRQLGRKPLVVDGRRVLNPADFERYEGIGLTRAAELSRTI